MRDWKEAEKWTNIYISNHPDNPYGYIRKWATLLYGSGDLDDASKVIDEGMSHTNSKFISQRVIINLYKRNYDEALRVLVSDSSAYSDF
jgi:hypothetical protein